MQDIIVKAICDAADLKTELVSNAVTATKDTSHGDYAFPCFVLSKTWKMSPPDCACKLANEFPCPKGISKVEAVGPYLNFFLDRALFSKKVVSDVLEAKLDFGKKDPNNKTILVDYSHPNIAKPFHVGHLRTTLIGHSLYQIYSHLGYTVLGINHLGDWGTQFGFVYAGCKLWGTPEDPDVDDLVEIYKKATSLKEDQEKGTVSKEDADKPDINAMARDYFIKLQEREDEAREFWEWCLDISLDYFKLMYKRLGIHFDYYHGESFYEEMLPALEKTLKESGIVEESRGAYGVDLGKKLGFARIFAEDGRSLYITRDITAADYRYHTFSPEKILYVVADQQALHFKQLVEVLKRMGHPVASKIKHIPFGMIPGIKTRGKKSDKKISLKELLDDAHERALEAYRTGVSKRPEDLDEELIAESVGLGAIFYNYLCRGNIKNFNFTWEEALNFQGDTGPYIQYALARLNSIEQKAKEAGISVEGFEGKCLEDGEAYELVNLLSRFDSVLEKAAADYEPYHIAQYACNLARTVSGSYKKLRVIGAEDEEFSKARLALFIAAKYALHTSLRLIGVPPLERM